MKTIEFKIIIEPRDDIQCPEAITTAPNFDQDEIDRILNEFRDSLLYEASKYRGYVVFGYGPLYEDSSQ